MQHVSTYQEPRQTTSNIGHLNKPSITALIHGLNRILDLVEPGFAVWKGIQASDREPSGSQGHYYSIAINYRKNDLEQKMLLNLGKKKWQDPTKPFKIILSWCTQDGLKLTNFGNHEEDNEKTVP